VRPVGASSVLIMKVRPQVLGMPGKNSASFESGGMAVFTSRTRHSPIWLRAIMSTVSARSTRWPLAAPRFRIMRTNFR
jgi:hypothetical protein